MNETALPGASEGGEPIGESLSERQATALAVFDPRLDVEPGDSLSPLNPEHVSARKVFKQLSRERVKTVEQQYISNYKTQANGPTVA